jgi:hypothetical protein
VTVYLSPQRNPAPHANSARVGWGDVGTPTRPLGRGSVRCSADEVIETASAVRLDGVLLPANAGRVPSVLTPSRTFPLWQTAQTTG